MKLIRYEGNFVECKKQIEEAKQEIATARQGMQDRIAHSSSYENKGCWHSEGIARIDGINHWCQPEFAPTTNYPEKTLESNKAGEYLNLTDKTIVSPSGIPFIELIPEIAENDAKLPDYEKRILIPKNQQTFSVASDSLGDVDIALFLSRNQKLVEQYGNFLKEKCGIDNVTFYQISNKFNNVGAGFWLRRLGRGGDSGFDGDDRNFYVDDGSLFGVAKRGALSQRESSAKPTQKILVYNPSDLKILQEVRKGDLAPRALEKIIERFL